MDIRNLGVLFSGGKDSTYAIFIAKKLGYNIRVLITLESENEESYMFQSTGVEKVEYLSKALDIPLIKIRTKGEKEKELKDLRRAIRKAMDKYRIEGILTGAIKSSYQATRIQKICDGLWLWSFNPLWQKDEIEYLNKLLENNFKIKIISIASYPLNKNHLGKILNKKLVNEFIEFNKKYGFNPAGEGGEIETIVLDSPLHKFKLEVRKENKVMTGENSGYIKLEKLKLVKK